MFVVMHNNHMLLDKNQLEKTAAEIQKIEDQIGLGSVMDESS